MKALFLAALCLLASLPAFVAQSPAPASLTAEIAAQQQLISANQAKIDEKLATLGEELRLAKIYASRGGAK